MRGADKIGFFQCRFSFLFFAADNPAVLYIELDLPEDVSLYKVSHHGRYCSESVSLIEKLSPAYAVVTSDQADDEILQALEDSGSEVFYTVGHTVSFLSDGHVIVPKA